jgi:rhodanese-related sulfurtransferase
MPVTKSAMQLVAEANARVRTLSVAEAATLLDQPDVTFVDLRDPRELDREGMIPGAFHAPRGMLEFWVDPATPYYKPIFGEERRFVLYCGGGWRSALAAATLIDMGFDKESVAHVDGGFAAWKAADAPVVDRPQKHGSPSKES